VLGIGITSAEHNTFMPKIVDGLEYDEKDDALHIVGGLIPEEDRVTLYDHGVAESSPPGPSMNEAIEFVREYAPDR
jgi:methylmalonyl-CoA mutase cobalamin-binding domain/chain